MRRRRFIAGLTGIAMGGAMLRPRRANAQSAPARTLVNIMLIGGADLRHVIVPSPTFDPSYVNAFWAARRGLYTQNYADYAALFAAEYRPVSDPLSGMTFGIHRSCDWLQARFTAGDVAIVCNTIGSDNRRHDHSQLIVDAGDPHARQADTMRDGWGGRFVETLGTGSNVIVVSDGLTLFGLGRNPVDRLAQVIHAKSTRAMALPMTDASLNVGHERNNMIRALRAYYAARGREIETEKPANWPYRRLFGHFRSLDAFGGALAARLAAQPMPAALAQLSLNNASFAQQCRNLYDCTIAADVLRGRVISMNYAGWDSHAGQQSKLNAFLPDLFGATGGLATVARQLDTDAPGANRNVMFTFATDFGRQLAANGGRGTDHGRGNYTLLIGNDVRGGIYGEPFPAREARPDPADSLSRAPLQIPGADILGRTENTRVLARVCDWAAPGTGPLVFPDAARAPLEPGVDLAELLAV